jgi:hypothetical protein
VSSTPTSICRAPRRIKNPPPGFARASSPKPRFALFRLWRKASSAAGSRAEVVMAEAANEFRGADERAAPEPQAASSSSMS